MLVWALTHIFIQAFIKDLAVHTFLDMTRKHADVTKAEAMHCIKVMMCCIVGFTNPVTIVHVETLVYS